MPKNLDFQLTDTELLQLTEAVRQEKHPEMRKRSTAIRLLALGQKPLEILLICFVAASIWLPRRITLNRVVTTDEIQWFYRSGGFNLALKQFEYLKTYQREHLGVTIMWAGSVAYDNVLRKYKLNNPD
jgi:hypothetical protein